MRSGIQHHGTFAQIVKDVARRYGWEAETRNVGIDPLERDAFGNPKQTPNRGDVLMTNNDNGAQTLWEYELPEDPAEVEAQVKSIIMADRVPTEKEVANGAVPA